MARIPQTRRSKYYAIKTKVDGITFDSKREAEVYEQLKMLAIARKISLLEVHPAIELTTCDFVSARVRVGKYEADFSFVENGQKKWVDVKGFDTALSKWKRRHVKAQYGIDVEVWK